MYRASVLQFILFENSQEKVVRLLIFNSHIEWVTPLLGYQYTLLLEAPKPVLLIPCYNTQVNTIKQLLYQIDAKAWWGSPSQQCFDQIEKVKAIKIFDIASQYGLDIQNHIKNSCSTLISYPSSAQGWAIFQYYCLNTILWCAIMSTAAILKILQFRVCNNIAFACVIF